MVWEDPLEKEMPTHSRILVWWIPWTEEPGGLQSMGSHREGHNWVTNTNTTCMLLLLLLSCFSHVRLCATRDSSPPGPTIPGILQARTLEWVAISSSNAWKWKVKAKSLSRVRLLATPWTAAYQAPLSMGFSRQEYWSGVPLPSPNTTRIDTYK